MLWQSLSNPYQHTTEWIDRAVFVFHPHDAQKQSATIKYVAACLDDKVIDIPFCNARGWHSRLFDKGQVKNNGESDLSDIASSCCDMANIKWSADDEWGEDIIDTIEAVTLGP